MALGNKYKLIQAKLPYRWRSRWQMRDKTHFQSEMKFLLEELQTQYQSNTSIHYWIHNLTEASMRNRGISSRSTFKAITIHFEKAFWKLSCFLVRNLEPQRLMSPLWLGLCLRHRSFKTQTWDSEATSLLPIYHSPRLYCALL